MKLVKTKIGKHRGFHSLTSQFLGFASELNDDEKLILDLSGNYNAYQDDTNDKNTWGQWFEQDNWNDDDIIREVGGLEAGSTVGGWISSEQRIALNKIMKKNLVVKPHILNKVDKFVSENFSNHKVLGIHIRGTDVFHNQRPKPKPPLPFRYITRKIDLYIEKEKYDRVYVASDQIHTINKLKEIYGDIIINYPSLTYNLMEGHEGHIYNKNVNEGYMRGEDSIVESILLSQTNFLLRTLSNFTTFSLIYNSTIDFCEVDLPFHYCDTKNYAEPPKHITKWCKYETDINFCEEYRKEIELFDIMCSTPNLSTIEREEAIKKYF